MKKFNLLLLDADVVIHLFEMGIWESFLERCDVHLAETVVVDEALYYEIPSGERRDIDLGSYCREGSVKVFSANAKDVQLLHNRLGPYYLEQLDPGEEESLAFLLKSDLEYLICSADKIVYRILGTLNMDRRGISVEEILQRIGLTRSTLHHSLTRAYREHWTRKGFQDGFLGLSTRKPDSDT